MEIIVLIHNTLHGARAALLIGPSLKKMGPCGPVSQTVYTDFR